MFTKQNTKQKFTNTSCLQNKTNVYNTNVYKTKTLQTRYVYKTKYKRKVYKHVMFTKQNKTNVYNTKVYKTKVYNTNVYKTKQNKKNVYRQVIFINQTKVILVTCSKFFFLFRRDKLVRFSYFTMSACQLCIISLLFNVSPP